MVQKLFLSVAIVAVTIFASADSAEARGCYRSNGHSYRGSYRSYRTPYYGNGGSHYRQSYSRGPSHYYGHGYRGGHGGSGVTFSFGH